MVNLKLILKPTPLLAVYVMMIIRQLITVSVPIFTIVIIMELLPPCREAKMLANVHVILDLKDHIVNVTILRKRQWAVFSVALRGYKLKLVTKPAIMFPPVGVIVRLVAGLVVLELIVRIRLHYKQNVDQMFAPLLFRGGLVLLPVIIRIQVIPDYIVLPNVQLQILKLL